ncbi:MAG: gluconolaconase, partial [Cephaloticoccus sp.]|nr:gluconolaconase [Cephaloticoccus sp.]
MKRLTPLIMAFTAITGTMTATSFYTARLEDPQAVYFTADNFTVGADGIVDDTAALQQAIDRVQETTRRGIVFIPAGRYRLTRELRVWSGIRLIGYGATRPVFFLAPNTPGYQAGSGNYLVHFVSERPDSPDAPVRDANPGTFYSAMSNIDIEIGTGNPAAVGVRSHFAQHGYLAHMDFRIGEGRAGIEEVGNEGEDLHFFGGEFGLIMHKPSPSWPYLLVDATFAGQRTAAIETEEGGLTLIRPQFRDVPTAILVRENRAEELWIKDGRFESISGPALVISDEKNARTQINLQNTFCADVPVFARFRESGGDIPAPGPLYQIKEFSHGLQIAQPGAAGEIKTVMEAVVLDSPAPAVPSDIPSLPPQDTWVNLRDLGAKGDGVGDDTAVLRAAIAQHRTIYLPSGRYRVTDTITLQPDTVLIGLNPITTQILITDYTPAFQGVNGPTSAPSEQSSGWWSRFAPPFPGTGAPKPLLESSRGGDNIITGIGLDTGGINNRALALKWMASAHSLLNDVRFIGGHGTYGPDGKYLEIYNNTRSADADPQRRWGAQYPSLWVTAGGGGTFKGLWTPSPFASAGLAVTETTTSGRIYALSSEHHVRSEVIFRNVSNWQVYALQTEEERGESPSALPLEIDQCSNLTFANFFIYRVNMDTPFSTGIRVTDSHDIDFRGLHVYSPGKLSFDNTLVDTTTGMEVRSREIAWLHLPDQPTAVSPPPLPSTIEAGAQVERLVGGFNNIDGLIADDTGNVRFVDARWSTVYRWDDAAEKLTKITAAGLQPVALALDHSGGLLIVSGHGNVYALPPGADEFSLEVLTPATSVERPAATAWLPVSRWRDAHNWLETSTRTEPWHFLSPDGSAFIPAHESYLLLGQPDHRWGLGTVDLARTYALAPAVTGQPFYASDEFGQKTWRFVVQPNGTLTDPELFAEEGEAGTAFDAAGNVYVCAGQVFVYDPTGRSLGVIAVPERPSA